ncbi:MAG: TetR/AcrR family transcriptional regulator [Deltaproteobacteria bacterium]|nr:TetR/AcrR family transcriptional regulator [Deltaproteobacteria bacterium]MCB9489777.1 TetR/AcrR family transcriptional regulator [Deltaproteobacteria bacterium]
MPKKTFEKLSERQQNKILKVCLGQFAKYGYDNTSIKTITSRLRVADGYLYYYFDGKEDIVKWVIDWGIGKWIEEYRAHLDATGPVDMYDNFKQAIIYMANFIQNNRDLYGFYFQLIHDPNFVHRDYLAMRIQDLDYNYEPAIDEKKANGVIRSDLPSDTIAMLFDVVATRLHQFIHIPKEDPVGVSQMNEEELGRFVDQIVSIFRYGIEPR